MKFVLYKDMTNSNKSLGALSLDEKDANSIQNLYSNQRADVQMVLTDLY